MSAPKQLSAAIGATHSGTCTSPPLLLVQWTAVAAYITIASEFVTARLVQCNAMCIIVLASDIGPSRADRYALSLASDSASVLGPIRYSYLELATSHLAVMRVNCSNHLSQLVQVLA